jgi:hypothetical protein
MAADEDLHSILLTVGRVEGRLDTLLKNHLPHMHTEIVANRRLTLWVGGVLTTLITGMFVLLARIIIG